MFQLIHLRFTEPRADPTAFAAVSSQIRGLLANRAASPDIVFRQTLDAALSGIIRGGPPRRRPLWPSGTSPSRPPSTSRASRTPAASPSSSSAASRRRCCSRSSKPTSRACQPRTWVDVAGRRRRFAARGRREDDRAAASRPRARWPSSSHGPFEYDDAHLLAIRAMTMVLQSRLFDTIRQELGATYSIEAEQRTQKVPKPEYTLRIEWTSDPARTASAGAARVRRDSVRPEHQAVSRPGGADSRGPTARFRTGQPGQRLSAEPDHAQATRMATLPAWAPFSTCRDQIEALTGAAVDRRPGPTSTLSGS